MNKYQESFAKSKALYDTVVECERKINQQIADNYEFFFAKDFPRGKIKKGDRITVGSDLSFLVEDTFQWEKYIQIYESECKKEGIFAGHNQCVDYIPRKLYLEAGNCLIDWFFEKIPHNFDESIIKTAKMSIKYREKIIDLAMSVNMEA